MIAARLGWQARSRVRALGADAVLIPAPPFPSQCLEYRLPLAAAGSGCYLQAPSTAARLQESRRAAPSTFPAPASKAAHQEGLWDTDLWF